MREEKTECVSHNIPVIPTQFEVATVWKSGYSKVETEFIKTQNCPQTIPCASFEHCRNITSGLGSTLQERQSSKRTGGILLLRKSERRSGNCQTPAGTALRLVRPTTKLEIVGPLASNKKSPAHLKCRASGVLKHSVHMVNNSARVERVRG